MSMTLLALPLLLPLPGGTLHIHGTDAAHTCSRRTYMHHAILSSLWITVKDKNNKYDITMKKVLIIIQFSLWSVIFAFKFIINLGEAIRRGAKQNLH